MKPIQMQLSQNQKKFLNFFLHFQDLRKTQNTLEQKMSLGSYLFLKLQIAKRGITEMLKKTRVRTLMDSQHVKVSETLVKSARLYICDIF